MITGDEWIDKNASGQLPLLRDRGEGQRLEFMAEYPTNGHELSKEIAAFATSEGGTILIGISDDGELCGLENVDTPRGRDNLCRRIEGVCSGNVRPAITPVVIFAKEEDAIVLVIEVPRGQQPIYYNKHTPYIRHLSQSRPAEPHEVIEMITEYVKKNPLTVSDSEDATSQFLSNLTQTLINILIYGGELEERNVNPWLESVKTGFGFDSELLRHHAAENIAVEMGIDREIRKIADNLDAAAKHRLSLGSDSWDKLKGYVSTAVQDAVLFKEHHIDVLPMSAGSKTKITETIHRSARELTDLDRRAQSMADDGRVRDIQEAASIIGNSFLNASYHLTSKEDMDYANEFRELGHALHLIETERLYLDGGKSKNKIIGQVRELNTRVQELIR